MFERTRHGKAALFAALAAVNFSVCAQTLTPPQITSLYSTSNGWFLGWQGATTASAFTVQFQDSFEDIIWRIPASRDLFPLASNSWLDFEVTNTARYFRVLAVPPSQRGKIISARLSTTLSTATLSLLFS